MTIRRRSSALPQRSAALSLALCWVALPATLAPTLVPTVAHAQDDEYRHTVEQALAEFESGNFAESLALFRRAHTMRPSARTFRGLGKASFELRRYVDAVTYFTEALASTSNPLTDEQRTEVTGLLSRAQAFVGRYAVTTEPEDAAVAVDGNEATHDLVLDIGEHTITAAAAGFVTATRRITVAGGEDGRLTMRLEPSTAEVVVEERVVERVRTDPGEPLRIAGWVIGGFGVGGLVLGVTAVGVFEDRVGAYNASVAPPLSSCPALDGEGRVPTTFMGAETPRGCLDYEATWRAMDPLRYVGFIGGGILLATGVVFLVLGSTTGPSDTTGSSDAAAGAARTEPRVRDVARGIAFVRNDSAPTLSMGCGPFADLGIACTGRY